MFKLPDPGFVPNTPDFKGCFKAVLLMAMRAAPHAAIPSMSELSDLLNDPVGKYSWPFAGLSYLDSLGFETIFWSELSISALAKDPEVELLRHYGEEVGRDQIENSDLEQLIESAKEFLGKPNSQVKTNFPKFSDVKGLLEDGFYLNFEVNQKLLQGDPGYVGHGIFVFGYTNQSVIAHNPGPPPVVNSEIPWYTLDRAWSVPNESGRILIGMKPPPQPSWFDYCKDHE